MNFSRTSFALLILTSVPFHCFASSSDSAPPLLTFPELVSLALTDPPPPSLEAKLNALLTTPFIHNDASTRPEQNSSSLDVAEWNINRGENEQEVLLALADAKGYLSRVREDGQLNAKQTGELSSQLQALQKADIVVLDEVDYGVKRTKYHNVARDIASALHMNYAYAVEFVELNRIYMGSRRQSVELSSHARHEDLGLDSNRYLGLEGSAILSRYPIVSAKIIRLPEEYDWYHGEIQAESNIEKVRRWSADRIFDEEIKRQVRRGGRMAIVVDLRVPGSPTGIVTVVCPHLEDYCGEKGRRKQINALLTQLLEVRNPVILAGDMNTIGHSGRPLTPKRALQRYVLNYRFWARQVLYFFLPIPAAGELFHAANYFKNFHDPTAFSVPLVLSNPCRAFFNDVRAFRFADGGRFNFDGDKRYSFGRKGHTLADSNERVFKGFASTFSFNRTFGGLFGVYKIDWFFVKPVPSPSAPSQDRLRAFAPKSGRTLGLINTSLGPPRISDHVPIVVTVESASTGVGVASR